tara:strand:- start:636 stop:938 length:303 start_codon:yes stop_codon:yes gene_type:complete
MSEAFAAFKSGFGFGKEEKKKLLPKQFPKSAPLSSHKTYYEKYVEDGFAVDFLKDKGMKIPSAYKADSFGEYLKMRGIDASKAYGGRVQPRKAASSSETK